MSERTFRTGRSARTAGASGRELRRELPYLLPVAIALFAIVGVTTLVSYRIAIERFDLERRNEALGLAERLVDSGILAQRIDAVQRHLPPGAGVAILAADGAVLSSWGLGSEEGLPGGMTAIARGGASVAWGPELLGRPAVVALMPIAGDAGRTVRIVRVDLPAYALAAQRRTLRLLTPVAVGVTIAVSILLALYFRQLLRPYDTIVERARALGGAEAEAADDELDFLLATFDRALATIGAPAGDLAPLAGTLGRSLDGGFLLLGPELDLLVATPAAVDLLGIEPPAPGSALSTALAAIPGAAEALAEAFTAGTSVPRGSLRLGDGASASSRRGSIGFTAEPLRGEGGRLRGWLVVLADLTEHERHEARERLADGLAQLGELAAGVAHELRNGLAALAGWLELARRESSADLHAEYLDEIARESRQLARVVEDFLAFARPGTRRLERFDLAELLRRVATGAGEPGVQVTTALPETAVELEGDPALLERAVRNLVDNAARAARDSGTTEPVSIELLAAAAGSCSITVLDRGAGIPAAVRARLFEPFVTGRADGVGLGLALARRIVVLHGGEITLHDRPGGGTVASVTLPVGASDT